MTKPAKPQLPKASTSGSVSTRDDSPIYAITSEIDDHEGVSGYLPAAQEALIAYSDTVTKHVGVEAVKVAAKRSATAVDKSDVLAAARSLYPRDKVEYNPLALGLLGVVLGAAFSLLITAATSIISSYRWQFSTVSIVVIVCCLFWVRKMYVKVKGGDSA